MVIWLVLPSEHKGQKVGQRSWHLNQFPSANLETFRRWGILWSNMHWICLQSVFFLYSSDGTGCVFLRTSVIAFLGIIFSLKLRISMVNYDSFQSNFAVLLVLIFGWQLLYLDAKHKSAVEMICVLGRIKVAGGYQDDDRVQKPVLWACYTTTKTLSHQFC